MKIQHLILFVAEIGIVSEAYCVLAQKYFFFRLIFVDKISSLNIY